MDNPAMAYLLPSNLLSKKDILFGNMSEIYQFHKRCFLQLPDRDLTPVFNLPGLLVMNIISDYL